MNLFQTAFPWRDLLGVIASVGCAIHCAAMPFVIAYLPLLGLNFLADEAFHRWMALVCFVIAIAAFVPGFRKHKRFMPGMIAAAGLLMITAAAFGLIGDCCTTCVASPISETSGTACTDACCEHCMTEAVAAQATLTQSAPADTTYLASVAPLNAIGPWVTPLGGLLLVAAHLLNRRFGCMRGCCGTSVEP